MESINTFLTNGTCNIFSSRKFDFNHFRFDFVLTLATQIFNIAFSFVKVARTAKAGRLLRISKVINQQHFLNTYNYKKAKGLFRVIAAFRGAKLFRCFYFGLRSLNRIKRFIKDLMLCFPIGLLQFLEIPSPNPYLSTQVDSCAVYDYLFICCYWDGDI